MTPHESYIAAASTDTIQAVYRSSSNAELAPGTLQTRVPLEISGGDAAQNDDTVCLLIALNGTECYQLTLDEYSSLALCLMQNEVCVCWYA